MARLAFVATSSGAAAPTASAPRRTRTPRCTANSPYAPDPLVNKSTLNTYLAARAAERARAIAADSAAKAAAWEAELALLRAESNDTVRRAQHNESYDESLGSIYTTSATFGSRAAVHDGQVAKIDSNVDPPVSTPTSRSYAQRLSSIYNAPTTFSSRAAVQAFVDGQLYANSPSAPAEAQEEAEPASVSETESKVSSPVSTLAPNKSSEVLTIPESTGSLESAAKNPPSPSLQLAETEETVPAPEPVTEQVPPEPVVQVPESVAEQELVPEPKPIVEQAVAKSAPVAEPEPVLKETPTPAPAPAEEPKSASAPVTKASKKSETGLKSLSNGLIDAIVDGMEPKPTRKKRAVNVEDIPANIIDAVNEGKLNTLTVTKLRRMLSQCGLKTAGRKSELIARLTSFVRK